MRARPLSRGFSKRLEGRWSRERGGAKGGAPLHKGRTRAGHALVPLGFSLSSSSLALPLHLRSSALAVLEAESFPRFGPVLAAWRAAWPRRHGRETQQRRLCGGPARLDEECRRGFTGRERSRGQARPRRRSWERGLDGPEGKSLFSFSGCCMDAVAPCPASRIVQVTVL